MAYGSRGYLMTGTSATLPILATGDTNTIGVVTGETAGTYHSWTGTTWTGALGVGGFLPLPVIIEQGGHGTTGKTTGFDALSPTTTKGDLIVRGQTNNERMPAPSDGMALFANSGTLNGWTSYSVNTPVTLFMTFQTAQAWTLALGVSDAFGGVNRTNSHVLDFRRFREARLSVRAANSALSAGNVDLIVWDVSNGMAITPPDLSFPAGGTYFTLSSSWGALSSATRGSTNAEYEIQTSAGATGDLIRVGTATLELR